MAGILVTGSRSWDRWEFIWVKLDEIWLRHQGNIVLYHGHCPDGTDAHADKWAASRGVPDENVHRYPANWVAHGKGAGHRRNAIMVRDFYWSSMTLRYPLAFRRGGEESKGTTGCIKAIKRAGDVPTIYEYEDIFK